MARRGRMRRVRLDFRHRLALAAERLPDACHMMPLEAAAAVTATLLAFLDEGG